MTYDTVLYDKRDDGIASLTLNRPAAGNSINAAMDREIAEIWEDVKADDRVKVVVISGAGDRFFCSGADMKEWAATRTLPMARMPDGRGFRLLARDHKVYKPIVCAVNGICGGGGLHFVNDSDIVICAESATFMDPHVSVGQVSSEEPIALTRRVPFEFAMRLTLMGVHERVDAKRALQVGLVSEVVPSARLMSRALEIARTLTRNSLAAMMKSKQAIVESLELPLSDALDRGFELIKSHWQHPDYVEGPRAFAEKRAPKWK
jgi:enoyl-CoA hydratase/carnithine racemase